MLAVIIHGMWSHPCFRSGAARHCTVSPSCRCCTGCQSCYLSPSLSLYIYIYIYICIYTHTYACIGICMLYSWLLCRGMGSSRKGANGVSTKRVTAFCCFFGQRDFLVTPVNLLLSTQKCQGVPFSPICQNCLLLQRPY